MSCFCPLTFIVMRRFGETSFLRTVCAVVGMAIALSGCAAIRSPKPDPAAPTPGRSSSPSQPPASPRVDPRPASAEAPPMGLDVRYIDEDGNFTVLRVDDLPR